MTYRALYLWARAALKAAGIDDPGRDAVLLTEHVFGLDRTKLALQGEKEASPAAEKRFRQAVRERAERRPLQYILGSWEFMGLTLAMGEGVLTPREDTETLVRTAALRATAGVPCGNPAEVKVQGLDLCAGSGAVALGLASLLPQIELTCIELSPAAFSYLTRNLAAYPQYAVKAEQGDILLPQTAARFADGSVDLLTANPPYIKTAELPGLQEEVQREPRLALDGGADGLVFYRAICELWVRKLRPGGLLAVEIGEEQGESVSALFHACGLREIKVSQDWAGKDRCVCGQAKLKKEA